MTPAPDAEPPARAGRGPGAVGSGAEGARVAHAGGDRAIDHVGTRNDLAFRRRHHLQLGLGSAVAVAGGGGLFLGLFRSHAGWHQILAFLGLAVAIAGVIVLANVVAGMWATFHLRRVLAAAPWRVLPQHQVVRIVLGTEGSSPLAIAFDDTRQPHEPTPDPPATRGVAPSNSACADDGPDPSRGLPRDAERVEVRRVVSVQASKRRMRAVQDGDVLLTRVAGPHGPWWALARSGHRWLVLAKEPSRFDHRMFRRRAPQLYDPTP